jgi:hypothetical protein
VILLLKHTLSRRCGAVRHRKNNGSMKIVRRQLAMKAMMNPDAHVAEYCSNIPRLVLVP